MKVIIECDNMDIFNDICKLLDYEDMCYYTSDKYYDIYIEDVYTMNSLLHSNKVSIWTYGSKFITVHPDLCKVSIKPEH